MTDADGCLYTCLLQSIRILKQFINLLTYMNTCSDSLMVHFMSRLWQLSSPSYTHAYTINSTNCKKAVEFPLRPTYLANRSWLTLFSLRKICLKQCPLIPSYCIHAVNRLKTNTQKWVSITSNSHSEVQANMKTHPGQCRKPDSQRTSNF